MLSFLARRIPVASIIDFRSVCCDFSRENLLQSLSVLWRVRSENLTCEMKNKIFGVFTIILIFCDLSGSLKCYLTGYSWPKECSSLIHERYGTNPACLSAIVLDGDLKKNICF